MSSKLRRRKQITMVVRSLNMASFMKLQKDYGLLMYTILTFIIVVVLYIATKDWKGVTCPEEVDIGTVSVPARPETHVCRRKHSHARR